jgi:hypothetical protein
MLIVGDLESEYYINYPDLLVSEADSLRLQGVVEHSTT